MICQRCLRSFRGNDSGRCNFCDSKYHTKCIAGKDMPGSGDRGQQWRCELCQTLAEKTFDEDSRNLLNIISNLRDKFEVVNKFQLPKLNGELAHLKYMSDYIAKQNEQILQKMSDIEKSNNKRPVKRSPSHYRKRHVSLRVFGNFHTTHKHKNVANNDHVSMKTEKAVSYRTQRRTHSNLFKKMLHLLNGRLKRSTTKSSPRKRRR